MLRDPTHVIGRVSSTASFSQAIKSPILNVTPTPCPPTRTDSGNFEVVTRSAPLDRSPRRAFPRGARRARGALFHAVT